MLRRSSILTACVIVGTVLAYGSPASKAAASKAPTAAPAAGVLDPYLRIAATLAEDKLEGVASDAKAIGAAAAKLGEAGGKVKDAAADLAKATDIETARGAFGTLSASVITLVGDKRPEGVKLAYCSMADKQWLQRGSTIRNPYFGSVMLECGQIVEGK
jgi:uncharacterized protein DUF3347